MASRNPITVFLGQLTTTASASSYTVPANSRLTISAATFNNITAAGRTVTAQITPSGGSAYYIIGGTTGVTIPAVGAAPTTAPGLVGHTMQAGAKIELAADANTSVNAMISGYLQEG